MIASAEGEGPIKEKSTKTTREPSADLQLTRESSAHLQKANADAAAPRRRNFNAVDPTHTNPAFDSHEGDASASATSPTAVANGDKVDEEENDDWKEHTRCRYLRHYLNLHWASFGNVFKRQPIDHIREYFGESIAWYFAWAGKQSFLTLEYCKEISTIRSMSILNVRTCYNTLFVISYIDQLKQTTFEDSKFN